MNKHFIRIIAILQIIGLAGRACASAIPIYMQSRVDWEVPSSSSPRQFFEQALAGQLEAEQTDFLLPTNNRLSIIHSAQALTDYHPTGPAREIPESDPRWRNLSVKNRQSLEFNKDMTRLSTLRMPAHANAYIEPETESELQELVLFAHQQGIPIYFLGNASNTLFAERIPGLVISMKRFKSIAVDGRSLTVGAGVSNVEAIRAAQAHQLAGIEFSVGIPGWMGGAVVMNANYNADDLAARLAAHHLRDVNLTLGHVVKEVRVMTPEGEIQTLSRESLNFGYRESLLQHRPWAVLSVTLELQHRDSEEIASILRIMRDTRESKEESHARSLGCVFHPRDDSYVFEGQTRPANWFIERLGAKEWLQGGIRVDRVFYNHLLNTGNGTQEDYIALAQRIHAEVLRKFGVALKLEVKSLPPAYLADIFPQDPEHHPRIITGGSAGGAIGEFQSLRVSDVNQIKREWLEQSDLGRVFEDAVLIKNASGELKVALLAEEGPYTLSIKTDEPGVITWLDGAIWPADDLRRAAFPELMRVLLRWFRARGFQTMRMTLESDDKTNPMLWITRTLARDPDQKPYQVPKVAGKFIATFYLSLLSEQRLNHPLLPEKIAQYETRWVTTPTEGVVLPNYTFIRESRWQRGWEDIFAIHNLVSSRLPADSHLKERLGLDGKRLFCPAACPGTWPLALAQAGFDVDAVDFRSNVVRHMQTEAARLAGSHPWSMRVVFRLGDPLNNPNPTGATDWTVLYEPTRLYRYELVYVMMDALRNLRGIELISSSPFPKMVGLQVAALAQAYGLSPAQIQQDPVTLTVRSERQQPSFVEALHRIWIKTNEPAQRMAEIDIHVLYALEQADSLELLQEDLRKQGLDLSAEDLAKSLQRISRLTQSIPDRARKGLTLLAVLGGAVMAAMHVAGFAHTGPSPALGLPGYNAMILFPIHSLSFDPGGLAAMLFALGAAAILWRTIKMVRLAREQFDSFGFQLTFSTIGISIFYIAARLTQWLIIHSMDTLHEMGTPGWANLLRVLTTIALPFFLIKEMASAKIKRSARTRLKIFIQMAIATTLLWFSVLFHEAQTVQPAHNPVLESA